LPWLEENVTEEAMAALGSIARIARLERSVTSLAWVRDGVTAEEAAALKRLASIAGPAAEVATALLGLRWMQDGVNPNEANALRRIRSALRWKSVFPDWQPARVIRALPWLQDGVTDAKVDALEALWGIGRSDQSLADRIITMPFMETFTPMDALALEGLYIGLLWHFSPADLDLPAIRDGITDDMIPVIAVLSGIRQRHYRHLIPKLLDPTKTSVERRTITTPWPLRLSWPSSVHGRGPPTGWTIWSMPSGPLRTWQERPSPPKLSYCGMKTSDTAGQTLGRSSTSCPRAT
jgi:hypothetical protein